jgi:hypothetical protein
MGNLGGLEFWDIFRKQSHERLKLLTQGCENKMRQTNIGTNLNFISICGPKISLPFTY